MYNLNLGLLTLINMHVPLCTPLYYWCTRAQPRYLYIAKGTS